MASPSHSGTGASRSTNGWSNGTSSHSNNNNSNTRHRSTSSRSTPSSSRNGNNKRPIEVVDLTADQPRRAPGSSAGSNGTSSSQMRHGSNSSQQYQSSYNVPTVNQPVYPARHAPNFRRHRLEDVIATARRQRLSNSANEQGQVEIVDLEDDEEQRGRYAAEEAESRARLPEELVGDEDDVFQQGELYGVLDTKIVGTRFYNGRATVGEYVIVRREPTNQYDSNAIEINNVTGVRIGHLPRAVVQKLASLIDNFGLTLEGIITGEKGEFDCPIALKLFGPSENVAKQNLMTQMRSRKLPLGTAIARERDLLRQRQQQAERISQQRTNELRSAAAGTVGVVRGNGASEPFEIEDDEKAPEYVNGYQQPFPNSQQARGTQENPISLDDIMAQSRSFDPREMNRVNENFGATEDDLRKMPEAQQPAELKTKLLPYQLQGLAWMLDRESPQLPQDGQVVQLWKRERNLYVNIATNFSIPGPPDLCSGGILADDMGLGKTIQVISLLVADPKRAEGRTGPTLIVCPLGVMSNWSGQIAAHVINEKPLKVFTYHGSRKADIENLDDYDVVITTYGTMSVERPIHTPDTRKPGGTLFRTKFRRIVLDEGHQIRNPKSQAAAAACALQADSRWVLTGTPIVNTLRDLYSHVKFLRLSGGLSEFPVFQGKLIRPLQRGGNNEAELLLHALMGTLCLRRKKDMKFVDLKLPEFSSHIFTVQWRKQEREKYDAFAKEAKGILNKIRFERNAKDYFHVMEILLRMRQTCNHWKLTGERLTDLLKLLEENQPVSLTPENVKALQALLQVRIESREECSICLDDLHSPVITPCGHVFGTECIERVIETQKKCPMCRADLPNPSMLVEPALEFGEDATEAEEGIDTDSSKITALTNILRATAQKNDGSKTVVFSQWTSFLDVIQDKLEAEGFKFCRIDGKMTATQRDNSIRTLDTDPTTTIMLASLAVCGVGLNLVSANQVILADSWWAPAIEDQAIDRVYRLGQKRDVNVWRLIMENSIEEKVLAIQDDKRRLMATALRDGGDKLKKKEKRARMADVARLLGVGENAEAGSQTQALAEVQAAAGMGEGEAGPSGSA